MKPLFFGSNSLLPFVLIFLLKKKTYETFLKFLKIDRVPKIELSRSSCSILPAAAAAMAAN